MFDELCSELRDIIHGAIDENTVEGISMTYTDDGIAVTVGEELYSISIQKV